MTSPLNPLNEAARLSKLHACQILDSDPEPDYTCLAELAAQVCQCSTGAIAFIDETRQWIKARKACHFVQTPRNISFCGHTILQDDVLVVENALLDARFHDNPLVTGASGVRFYAGAPIISPEGHKLGSVCVVDGEPRSLSPEQQQMLQAIAQQVSRMLELRLQHRQLKKETEQQLEMERRTVQHALRDLESERQHLGYHLHENMAQVLAAVKLQLDMAAETPALAPQFVQNAKEHIASLLKEMRRVTYELIPVSLQEVPTQTLMQNLIKRMLKEVPAIIELHCEGAPELEQKIALTLFRVVEDAFDLMKQKEGLTRITLNLKTAQTVELVLKDNGSLTAQQMQQAEVVHNTIRNRISMQRGTLDTSLDRHGLHTLVAVLPAQAVA